MIKSREEKEENRVSLNEGEAILKVIQLGLTVGRPAKKLLEDVSLSLKPGSTFGLIGESGAGKTTLAKAILGLYKEAKGQVIYDGCDWLQLKESKRRKIRPSIQMIFQDTLGSLPFYRNVEQIIEEGVLEHGLIGKKDSQSYVIHYLELCGLSARYLQRFPNQLSGGERQRVCIARALALQPKVLIADEPVTALDISMKAGILNLMTCLQEQLNLAYLFISHDLEAIHYISDDVGILHKGKLIESGTCQDVFWHPRQDYTKKLIDSCDLLKGGRS